MGTRTLRDGEQIPEHEHPVHLQVVTRCPAKYRLVDLETGEVWQPRDEPPFTWRRIRGKPKVGRGGDVLMIDAMDAEDAEIVLTRRDGRIQVITEQVAVVDMSLEQACLVAIALSEGAKGARMTATEIQYLQEIAERWRLTER